MQVPYQADWRRNEGLDVNSVALCPPPRTLVPAAAASVECPPIDIARKEPHEPEDCRPRDPVRSLRHPAPSRLQWQDPVQDRPGDGPERRTLRLRDQIHERHGR